MKNILILSTILFSALTVMGQTVPNFTITDSDGVEHNLYEDHLDQGKTVVVKLFFTTCPPCIQLAPWMEEKYQQWGAGAHDVEFIELSTQSFDSNQDVAEYKVEHGVTFPGAGADGGSLEAALPYRNGTIGQYWGTPYVVIIAPDGTYTANFSYDDFDDLVAATGATGGNDDNGGEEDEPTTVTISSNTLSPEAPQSIKYFLKPLDQETPKIDILEVTGGSLSFEYPSDDFPEMENPVIIAEADSPANDGSISALDLLKIQRHILMLVPFQEEYQLLAADVNSDDKISAVDLLNLQRVILGLRSEFPNGTPSWKTIPSHIEVNNEPGTTVEVEFDLIKTGNVN